MPATAYLLIGDCFHGWEMIGFENKDADQSAIFRKGLQEKLIVIDSTRSWLSIMFELKAA